MKTNTKISILVIIIGIIMLIIGVIALGSSSKTSNEESHDISGNNISSNIDGKSSVINIKNVNTKNKNLQNIIDKKINSIEGKKQHVNDYITKKFGLTNLTYTYQKNTGGYLYGYIHNYTNENYASIYFKITIKTKSKSIEQYIYINSFKANSLNLMEMTTSENISEVNSVSIEEITLNEYNQHSVKAGIDNDENMYVDVTNLGSMKDSIENIINKNKGNKIVVETSDFDNIIAYIKDNKTIYGYILNDKETEYNDIYLKVIINGENTNVEWYLRIEKITPKNYGIFEVNVPSNIKKVNSITLQNITGTT